MQTLRAETRAEHDAIEAVITLDGVSLDDYCSLLKRFTGFYGPLERALESVGDWGVVGIDFDRRRKLPRLQADLAILGTPHGEDCPFVPQPANWSEALGVLYVLEGASLGGRVISRLLERTLALSAESGAAFFSGYGAATGAMWTSFCDALARYSPGPDPRIVGSAVTTFRALRHWCTGWKLQSTAS